jgi:hypothetical protein
MIEHDLLWALLPEGLEEFFEIESYEKTDQVLRIVLIEKNIVPNNLPEKYQNKPVVNTVMKPITIDYFPLKGRKGELILKRRMWQFKGIPEMIKRDINICAEGTKLEKEFADFLKEMDRE